MGLFHRVAARLTAPAMAGIAAFLTFAVPAQAANRTVQAAIDGFVRPAYARFADATQTLKVSVDGLCKTPSAAALDAARQSFRDVVLAWSRVETIRFGPVTEQNRLDRILYWPDRKGIGLKQVQAALTGEDPSAADAASLAGKSVAMQGLGALEFALAGADSDTLANPGKPYRCRFAAAVTGNLAAMAVGISADWKKPDGFAALWANPGPDNALYRTDKEAASELADIFIQGLEMLRDVRINGFLGIDETGDKPRQALFWRGQATLISIDGNIQGLRDLFKASDLAGLLTGDNAHIGNSIGIVLDNAAGSLSSIEEEPIADVLKDPAKRAKVERFRTATSALSELIGVRLTGALGLSAGFSSLDGD